MPGDGKQNNRDLAAVALASGRSGAEAAAAAGVSERTIRGWNCDPEFQSRVRELRDDMVHRAAAMLADAVAGAARVLLGLLASESETIRLRAAVAAIELGLKVGEMSELQKRLEDLERAAPAAR